MRLKKNRAERNRELLDGLEAAPEAFARIGRSATELANALKLMARAAGNVSVKHTLQIEPADNRVIVIPPELLN
jgi:hypothetical protein